MSAPQIIDGESGSSVRTKLNDALAGQFTVTPTYLGSELVEDGDLSTDPTALGTPWSLSNGCTYSTGQIASERNGNFPDFAVPIATVSGNTYLIELHQTVVDTATAISFGHNSGYFIVPGDGTVKLAFVATFTGDDTLVVDFAYYNTGATRIVTSVSVRQIDVATDAIAVTGYNGNPFLVLGLDPLMNMGVGDGALRALTSGQKNTGIGAGALINVTSGQSNVGVGSEALEAATDGTANTAVGDGVLQFCVSGTHNTGIGWNALNRQTGGYNTAVGDAALMRHTAGDDNTAVGVNALTHGTTCTVNTAIGADTLAFCTFGSFNTAIGAGALSAVVETGSNTAIGYHADVASGAIDNAIAIGANAVAKASNTAQIGADSVRSLNIGLADVVSTLPSAAAVGAGARSFVTDATMTMTLGIGTVVAGEGSEKVPVYSDGTDWIIG